jgi:hypothetical protein
VVEYGTRFRSRSLNEGRRRLQSRSADESCIWL